MGDFASLESFGFAFGIYENRDFGRWRNYLSDKVSFGGSRSLAVHAPVAAALCPAWNSIARGLPHAVTRIGEQLHVVGTSFFCI